MSSPLNKIELVDNGINQTFIYDKSISVNNDAGKIILSFRIDREYHIFKITQKECQHLINILTKATESESV